MGSLLQAVWNSYLSVVSTIIASLATWAGGAGGFTGQRPRAVIIGTVILAGLCAAGWVRIHVENQSDKLWVPNKSKSFTDKAYVTSHFETSARAAQIQATAKGSNNAIQLQTTWELLNIHQQLMALTSEPYEKQTFEFADICQREVSGWCQQSGYLAFWNSSLAIYASTVGGSANNAAAGSQQALINSVNNETLYDGSTAVPLRIFGLPTTNASGAVIAAEAVAITYLLDAGISNDKGDAWFNAFLELMKNVTKQAQFVSITYNTDNALDKEIGRSVTNDIYLIIISVVIYIVLAIVFLSRFDRVKTLTSLGLLGVLSIVLGLMAGYGISMLCGVPFTSLSELLPYIMIGVGLDMIFILVKGMEEVGYEDPTLSITRRMQRMMQTAGISVIITCCTNILAFGLGAISELPSVHWFSETAVCAVVGIMVTNVSFFTGCYVLTLRRIAARKVDFACCIVYPESSEDIHTSWTEQEMPPQLVHPTWQPAQGQPAKKDSSLPATTAPAAIFAETKAAAGDYKTAKPELPPMRERSLLKTVLTDYYAPVLLLRPVKVVVIAVFMAYFVVSIVAFQHVRVGQPLQDVVPENSFVIPYQDLQDATFGRVSSGVPGAFFRDIDQSLPAQQANMLKALNRSLDNECISVAISANTTQWMVSFIQWVQLTQPNVTLTNDGCFNPFTERVGAAPVTGCVPEGYFTPLLTEFLSKVTFFQNYVLLKDGQVTDSYFQLAQTGSYNDDRYNANCINAVRKTEEAVNKQIFGIKEYNGEDGAFLIWQNDFIFYEGDAVLRNAMIMFLVYASVGVSVILLLLLVNPLASIIMTFSVVLVTMYLFTEMWMLRIRFNNVSFISSIMAVGLAVDYTVYFSIKFMVASGNRHQRVLKAFEYTGGAILLGGITSLCGCLPLAAAKSTILKTFFKLLFGTILSAILVGLVLIPVVLSTIGPSHIPEALARENEVEELGDLPVMAPGVAAQQSSKR